jgi:hypothetical protein
MSDPIQEMLIAQGKMNDPNPRDPSDSKDAPLPTISSNLPDLTDNYIAIRAQRLVLAKQVEEMEEAEKDLYKTIIAKLREAGMSAVGGKLGLVKMSETVEPIAQDWRQTWDYIKKHDAFELLHKRLTVTAVKERWEAGEEVPGVGRVPKFSLSVSKS